MASIVTVSVCGRCNRLQEYAKTFALPCGQRRFRKPVYARTTEAGSTTEENSKGGDAHKQTATRQYAVHVVLPTERSRSAAGPAE